MGKAKEKTNGVVQKEINNIANNKKSENGDVKFVDHMSVSWTEKYDSQLTKFWNCVPKGLGQIIATVAVFAVGISINGDWLSIGVHISRQLGYFNNTGRTNRIINWKDISLESLHLKNFFSFWLSSMTVSYSIYYLIGGFLHWYYYVRRRDSAEEWKIQPKKWLPPDLERHEIICGTLTLFCNASFTAALSCFISNGGYSTVYYNISDYGWLWFFLQFGVIFIYQDYTTYWLHRCYHLRFLYQKFHKLHHKYKQPTAFSVTAIHPVESLHIQATLCLPLFLLPVHWFPFYFVAIYTYYNGIIQHSGIDFKAYWWQPWQPDAVFHDNHHQYFHVNFGFNISFWDKLHGTLRRKDRIYNEDIYNGFGKSLKEASTEEIKADLEEREEENTKAHRDTSEYLFSKEELENIGVTNRKKMQNGNLVSSAETIKNLDNGYNKNIQNVGETSSRTKLSKTTLETKSFTAVSRTETRTTFSATRTIVKSSK